MAQAVFAPSELRFQTCMDDPAGAARARTREERTILITIFLLIFRVLGFRFSWKKGQRGKKVDWIGSEFATEPGMVTAKLTEERAQRLRDTLETVDESKGMVATKVVIKAASVAAAAASVVPRARPFVAHLWGAAFDAQMATSQQRPGTRGQTQGPHVHQEVQSRSCMVGSFAGPQFFFTT